MDQFEISPELENLLFGGDRLAEFTHFITGATPDHVCNKVMKAIPDFQKGDAAKFINAAVIAAAKQRNQLEEFLALPGRENVASILGKHFSIEGRVNFTEMNLLGHMFLACGLKTEGAAIAAARQKFKAEHIWDADLSKARLSPKYLELVKSKVLQFKLADVVKIGHPTLLALVENDKILAPPEPAPTTVPKSEPVEIYVEAIGELDKKKRKFGVGGSDGSNGSSQIHSTTYDQRLVGLEKQLHEPQQEQEERRRAEERMKARILAQHKLLVQLCAQSGIFSPPSPSL